jgi:MFS family permease
MWWLWIVGYFVGAFIFGVLFHYINNKWSDGKEEKNITVMAVFWPVIAPTLIVGVAVGIIFFAPVDIANWLSKKPNKN